MPGFTHQYVERASGRVLDERLYSDRLINLIYNSARELMQKDKLRELAVVLFERVKANTSIDWTIKENARAKLKVIVKRTLRQYGYPPDMQELATETVLKQAEMLAHELIAAAH